MKSRFWFRAWDIVKKEMIQNVGVYNGQFIGEMDTQNNWHKFNNNGEDRFVLMQCTGQKDKEGNFIWEGDIVKCDIDYDKDGRVNLIRNVVYIDGAFFLSKQEKGIDDCPMYLFHNIEVIGNIYQHEII